MHLSLRGISKRYGSTVALQPLTLDAGPGMFGLLGPNGAGKSTLLRIVATLVTPTSGTASFGEIDIVRAPHRLRQILGYLPQEFGLYPNASVLDTLAHFLALKAPSDRETLRHRTHELLARVNLWTARDRAIETLSGGMRQRLGLAIALGGDPQLLLLDEPTAGLDPAERYRLYDLLVELAAQRVVVLSTHLVEDVGALCTTMAILHQGAIVAAGNPDDLTRTLSGRVWQGDEQTSPVDRNGARVVSQKQHRGRRLSRVVSDRAPNDAWASSEPTLEDLYFWQVGSTSAEST